MLKFVFIIIAVYFVFVLMRRQNSIGSDSGSNSKDSGQSPVEMVKDPTCGLFIEKDKSASPVKYYDKIYYFCSDDCRQKFIQKVKDGGNNEDLS